MGDPKSDLVLLHPIGLHKDLIRIGISLGLDVELHHTQRRIAGNVAAAADTKENNPLRYGKESSRAEQLVMIDDLQCVFQAGNVAAENLVDNVVVAVVGSDGLKKPGNRRQRILAQLRLEFLEAIEVELSREAADRSHAHTHILGQFVHRQKGYVTTIIKYIVGQLPLRLREAVVLRANED